jgi:uncharacterized MAPEG superfamily protein
MDKWPACASPCGGLLLPRLWPIFSRGANLPHALDGGDAMNKAYFCVLLAGFLPYVCAMVAKWGFQNFDNHNPRHWLAQQTGFRARANAAQANSFEAFAFFAAGVIIATFAQVDAARIDVYAIVFVAARVGFIVCYVIDKASWRSLFWLLGLLCVVGLFAAALGL